MVTNKVKKMNPFEIMSIAKNVKKDADVSVRFPQGEKHTYRIPKRYKEFLENVSGYTMTDLIVYSIINSIPSLEKLNQQYKDMEVAKEFVKIEKELRGIQKAYLTGGHYMEEAETKWINNPSFPPEFKENILRVGQIRRQNNLNLEKSIERLSKTVGIDMKQLDENIVTCHICGNPLLKTDANTGKENPGKFYWHKECKKIETLDEKGDMKYKEIETKDKPKQLEVIKNDK